MHLAVPRRIAAAVLAMLLGAIAVQQITDSSPRASAATSTLTPVADTYVDQANAKTKFGSSAQLVADASPVTQSLIRFDLAAQTAPIANATLRLHVDDSTNGGSPSGGALASTTDTAWSEAKTAWNNRPAINGATLASLGAVTRNTWVIIDVTSFVAARLGTKLSFTLTSTNTDGAYYDTRETGPTAPQLVITTVPPTTTTTAPPSTTTTPPTGPVTLNAVADTYVEDATPTTNYGTATQISVDAQPLRELLLRFDLTAVAGPLQQVKLRLHVANNTSGPSPAGGMISKVDDTTWTETGVTWNTRPSAWNPSIGSLGSVAQNTWVEIDVTNAVTAGAVNAIGLRSANSDGAYYDSREVAGFGPQLVVTTGTPPPPITGITIAAVGDDACAPGSAVTATSCRQQAIANQLAADPSVTWMLALGDLQYEDGALASFQASYDPSYGQLKAKTKPAPGNHEYGTAGAAGYFSYFGAAAGTPGQGYYSFDVGSNWHIVSLNSNCSQVACSAGSAQEQWLRADLAANARPCTIAFWHHPRFSSATHGNDSTVIPLWDALAQNGAELALNGHDHGYERFDPQTSTAVADPNGIRQFVVGTGGRSLYAFGAAHANSAVRISAFGYLLLTLGTNAYSWSFVGEGGGILDSGSGTCH